jgi:hypothetical protein
VTNDEQERIAWTYRAFKGRVLDAGAWMSGDERVGEDIAAGLLGCSPSNLKRMRNEGKGPRFCRFGGNGHRVTYRLIDLAEWVETQMQDPNG